MNEDKIERVEAFTEEVPDWTDEKTAGPSAPPELPPSSDKEFWGDDFHSVVRRVSDIAEETANIKQIMSNHRIQMQGQEFICSSCPHMHSIPLDPRKYTLNVKGQIVPLTTDSL